MEIYKDINGYEGYYQVSNFGNVKSLDRLVLHNYGGNAKKTGIILKQHPDKDGYLSVNLKKKQNGSTNRSHRLVAMAFIPNPENKPQVNHINGIKSDNRLENLEWVTLCENRQHAYDTGLQHSFTRQGMKNNFAKLTNESVITIRNIYNKKNGVNFAAIAKMYNVSGACIQVIIAKKTWKHLL